MVAEEWRPGSFTKNFSWGRDVSDGLKQLYENIKLGFNDEISDVPRALYRERVQRAGRPDFIPINFFLFNKIVDGEDRLIVDELVFQALNFEHSSSFDKLALVSFLISRVGTWRDAKPYQSRPALWATRYVEERVAEQFGWSSAKISADDIERFVINDPRYRAETGRKLATNLNHLFLLGRLREFESSKIERWWVDALFMAIDRLATERPGGAEGLSSAQYSALLRQSDFHGVSGPWSLAKDLAVGHLVKLYEACGGRNRFRDDVVKGRALKLPDVQWVLANDPRPRGAVHPTNPQILKSIPRSCAVLAKYAGFLVVDPDELAQFDTIEFVRRRTREALSRLSDAGIRPTMSPEQLHKMTRGE